MSDEVPSPTARMYSVNRQESPQPDLDLERQSLPHTTDGALDPGDLLEECVASGHGVAGAECACDCPSHEPNYTRADFMDPERIKVLSWQESVKRNDNVEDAKIVLIQRPDSSTEDTFTHDLGVRGEFFSEHAADTLRDWNITADGTHNWWHIAGSMTPGPLIRFHPGVGEVACSFLPFAATSKEITLAVESFRPAASGDDSIEPDRSIYTAQRAFRMHRCRLIVLSSGQFLPRWERPSRFVVFLYRLKTVEVWITAPFLLPFVLLYIFLKIVWPSAPDFFEIMFRRPKPLGRQRISKSYHETTFENTRWKTEPMLTQVLGMRKQMSLFKFNWDWVSVERHLAILEIIRDFHCRPDAVDSDKRLSEWALSAHLNYFAWNEVVRGIQEESDWLREHAIESPGQELEVCPT